MEYLVIHSLNPLEALGHIRSSPYALILTTSTGEHFKIRMMSY